ncbi:MAG: hypothetical protein RLW87_20865 [Alphaproteobacteria bacterium]
MYETGQKIVGDIKERPLRETVAIVVVAVVFAALVAAAVAFGAGWGKCLSGNGDCFPDDPGSDPKIQPNPPTSPAPEPMPKSKDAVVDDAIFKQIEPPPQPVRTDPVSALPPKSEPVPVSSPKPNPKPAPASPPTPPPDPVVITSSSSDTVIDIAIGEPGVPRVDFDIPVEDFEAITGFTVNAIVCNSAGVPDHRTAAAVVTSFARDGSGSGPYKWKIFDKGEDFDRLTNDDKCVEVSRRTGGVGWGGGAIPAPFPAGQHMEFRVPMSGDQPPETYCEGGGSCWYQKIVVTIHGTVREEGAR